MKPILSCRKLSKSYISPKPVELFSNIDLDVYPEDTLAIVGRSGEGKSTLLHLLGILDTPTSGEISLLGEKASYEDHEKRNKHIGFIFQQFHLLEDYTVIDNVLMPAYIARKPTHQKSPAFKKAQELLERVGLLSHQFHLAKHLSGGEKQRVAIARAFLNDPDIILADEPSGNLDRTTAESIHQLLLDFAKESNKACVIVTHDLNFAKLCARQYSLSGGTIHPLI